MKNRLVKRMYIKGNPKYYVAKINENELPRIHKEVKLTDNYSIVFSNTCSDIIREERKAFIYQPTDKDIEDEREMFKFIHFHEYYIIKIGQIRYVINISGAYENNLDEEIVKINENKEKEIEKFDNLVNWIFSDSTIEY